MGRTAIQSETERVLRKHEEVLMNPEAPQTREEMYYEIEQYSEEMEMAIKWLTKQLVICREGHREFLEDYRGKLEILRSLLNFKNLCERDLYAISEIIEATTNNLDKFHMLEAKKEEVRAKVDAKRMAGLDPTFEMSQLKYDSKDPDSIGYAVNGCWCSGEGAYPWLGGFRYREFELWEAWALCLKDGHMKIVSPGNLFYLEVPEIEYSDLRGGHQPFERLSYAEWVDKVRDAFVIVNCARVKTGVAFFITSLISGRRMVTAFLHYQEEKVHTVFLELSEVSEISNISHIFQQGLEFTTVFLYQGKVRQLSYSELDNSLEMVEPHGDGGHHRVNYLVDGCLFSIFARDSCGLLITEAGKSVPLDIKEILQSRYSKIPEDVRYIATERFAL